MLYLECLADEALARSLGLRRREISHELNKDEVLKRIFEVSGCLGMVDEDPNSSTPVQFGRLLKQDDYSEWGILSYLNSRRDNRLLVLCPTLEGWLLQSARSTGIRLDDPRYGLPVSINSLHRIVNGKLDKLDLLVKDLLAEQSPRILKLQELLTQ